MSLMGRSVSRSGDGSNALREAQANGGIVHGMRDGSQKRAELSMVFSVSTGRKPSLIDPETFKKYSHFGFG
jgi:hypothetical protein